METFTRRAGGYFNTFGGNPVACAAGMAMLDVLDREALQANALRMGADLRAALRAIGERDPRASDVRGAGLFTGVELVRGAETREPDAATARAVLNRLRHDGVLAGLTGKHGNVLKIRPPMGFAAEHAAYLIERYERALRSVSA